MLYQELEQILLSAETLPAEWSWWDLVGSEALNGGGGGGKGSQCGKEDLAGRRKSALWFIPGLPPLGR